MNTPQLERHMAALQIKHYLYLRQAAIDTANVDEGNRATNNIDRLVKEYGIQALHQAQEEM
ncbi:hypothetical protein D3C76_1558750 [compost metagenome]